MDLDIDEDSDNLSQGKQSPSNNKRRPTMDNPFLLPTYGSFNESDQPEKKEEKSTVKRAKSHLNFKRLAKAITQQRKLNSLLQVKDACLLIYYRSGQSR